jgi:hypothetical protein
VIAEDVYRNGDVEQDAVVQQQGDHMVQAYVGKI